jgi:hypothetical protein
VSCSTAGNFSITLTGVGFKCDSAITVKVGEQECADPTLLAVTLNSFLPHNNTPIRIYLKCPCDCRLAFATKPGRSK